jgi:hypothetical protein
MQSHRTTGCGQFGHREITVQLLQTFPVRDLHRMLTGYFESAVAGGSEFLPGQTVQLGWSQLRICERSDGTLGVKERELTPEVKWTESVDRALRDAWLQKEIVSSLGLDDALSFPRQDEAVLVTECSFAAPALVLMRLPNEGLADGFSGWTLSCAENHEHGGEMMVPLLALAAEKPALVQLLALPHDTMVLVMFNEVPGAPPGALRIEPHVFRDGQELSPEAGSYLATLQG